jgi:archaellum component FlaC
MPGVSAIDQLGKLDAALKSIATTASASADEVERASERIAKSVERTTREGGSKLDDFKFTLGNIGDAGNQFAQQLAAVIADVEAGIVRAEDAVHVMGDGFVFFEGQMRRAQDVLAEVLPSTGEVQRRIKEATAEVTTFEQVMERLNNQTNQVARDFAKMVDAFRKGRLSLSEFQKAAAEIGRQLPGSEVAELADIAEQLGRQGAGG